MLSPLGNPIYRRLFSAQVIALVGTGLMTIALGLLAFDIAGADGGLVMGIALSIKMIAYVVMAPVMTALLLKFPAKRVLIAVDLSRALIAVALLWVDQAWQIYVLIFLLQTASATFTPLFQAQIPAILPQEDEYTKALSLSRLAYDLEAVLSPMLAGALLLVMSFHMLFSFTTFGFIASALLVYSTTLTSTGNAEELPFTTRLSIGVKVFFVQPQMRFLLGVNLVTASAVALVMVNTTVIVQDRLGLGESAVTVILAAFGTGSMLVAFLVPKLLNKFSDVQVMTTAALIVPVALFSISGILLVGGRLSSISLAWFLLGALSSFLLTPGARILRRHSDERTRASVYTAQFALSHAAYLFSYPVAGLVGARLGQPQAIVALGFMATIGCVVVLTQLPRARSSKCRATNLPNMSTSTLT